MKARLDQVEAELKVRTDIMNVTSIVSEADKKGDILSVNEKFLEVSKYSQHELIGHGHNTPRPPDMPKEVFKQMWATIGRGDIFRGVWLFVLMLIVAMLLVLEMPQLALWLPGFMK